MSEIEPEMHEHMGPDYFLIKVNQTTIAFFKFILYYLSVQGTIDLRTEE